MTPQPNQSADTPTAPCVGSTEPPAGRRGPGGHALRPAHPHYAPFLTQRCHREARGVVDEDTHVVNGMTHELTGQLTNSGLIYRATWRAVPLSPCFWDLG